jgi:hypothetical protein
VSHRRTYAEWQAERHANAEWARLVDEALRPDGTKRPAGPAAAKRPPKRPAPKRLVGPSGRPGP